MAQTIDIPATVLARAGLEPAHGMQGQSLLPLLTGQSESLRSSVLIEEEGQRLDFGLGQRIRMRTLRTLDYRISIYDGESWGELCDLRADPLELRNLWNDPASQTLRSQLMAELAYAMLRQKGVPAVLFAIPDQATQSNLYEIAIPKLASFYLTHDWNGEVKGIKEFGDQHPPVGPVFWAFRIMVGVGLLMLAVSWFASYELKIKNTLSQRTAMVLVAMTFAGWVALVSGWYVTEIGRQPWLVHGVLTTAQASSQVPAGNIALSLAMYLTLYAALLSAYVSVVFYLAKKAVDGGHEPSGDLKGMRHA